MFVLKCEHGYQNTPSTLGTEKPQWWPDDIDFDDEILRRTTKKGVINFLMNITDLSNGILYFCYMRATLVMTYSISYILVVVEESQKNYKKLLQSL